MKTIRTQVGIIGAGPAGLLLGQMLHNRGIDAVIVERQTRDYVRSRLRAGIQEKATYDTFIEEGVGEKLKEKGLIHKGMYLNFNNESHYLNAEELTGGKVVIAYGQRNITCDMIDVREAEGLPLYFEAMAHEVRDLDGKQSEIRFDYNGEPHVIQCDFVAGCDGYHGISRKSIPASVLQTYEREYPFGWFGILAEAPPAFHENVYAHSADGFALQSMRGHELSRLYLQVPSTENIDSWSDDAFFDEFEKRVGAGYKVNRGKLVDKSLALIRSFVCEPMRYGNLFLAGDAAHIVPPTGAKGMNLAVADVKVLCDGLSRFYKNNDSSLLDRYSEICLRRVWKVVRFSWWFTETTHTVPDQTQFDYKIQLGTLSYIADSPVGAHSLMENYTGLDFSQ